MEIYHVKEGKDAVKKFMEEKGYGVYGEVYLDYVFAKKEIIKEVKKKTTKTKG